MKEHLLFASEQLILERKTQAGWSQCRMRTCRLSVQVSCYNIVRAEHHVDSNHTFQIKCSHLVYTSKCLSMKVAHARREHFTRFKFALLKPREMEMSLTHTSVSVLLRVINSVSSQIRQKEKSEWYLKTKRNRISLHVML